MRSISERSFGARIGNAESLVAALQNFNGYQAVKPEFSIDRFTDLIRTTKGMNATVAEKKQAYSLAVENRIQVFDKGQTSIDKILSPINTTVKLVYGRSSKEAHDVAAIIAKIRGVNKIAKVTDKSDEGTISQSYQSYHSKAQFFADLLVNLRTFGNQYQPVNATLSVSELDTVYANCVAANNEVMNSFAQFAQNNAARIAGYYVLSQTAIGIKDSVKAQYGFHSTEYRLIKGLAI